MHRNELRIPCVRGANVPGAASVSSLPPCRTCLAGGRTSRKIVLGWTPNPSSIRPQEKAPHQSCPLKRGTPGRRIPVYSNQLRQTVLGVTLGVFLWQDDSTPQMCHPQLQKGCVQPHALSTGSLQGHPQKCLLLANEMLGALDPNTPVPEFISIPGMLPGCGGL